MASKKNGKSRASLPVFPYDMTNPNVQEDLLKIIRHYVNRAEQFVQLIGFGVELDPMSNIYSMSISVRPKRFTVSGGGSRKRKPPKA